MQTKRRRELSTSMLSAKGLKSVTQAIRKKHDGDSTLSSAEGVASAQWNSRIEALSSVHEFQLEWDNDFTYHVARNIQEMRAHRGYTQAELAERAGVSQPKIARAESGDANLTAQMIERYIAALAGRLRFSIEPAEAHVPHFEPWWKLRQYLSARTHVTQQQSCMVHVSGGAVYGAWNHHLNQLRGEASAGDMYSLDSARLSTETTKLLEMPKGDAAHA